MRFAHTNLRPLLLALSLFSAVAQAAPVAFNAAYDGSAQIVALIDPVGPVVRFETTSIGNGVFDLHRYFSTDIVNLGTGVGSGNNRFVADNGDELFGDFTVQIFPIDEFGALGLLGTTVFSGGTGQFSGASGAAQFSGNGRFISETTALTSLVFRGELALVPEPGSAALVLAGLLAGVSRVRRTASHSTMLRYAA